MLLAYLMGTLAAMAFEELREDYDGPALEENSCSGDPLDQFRTWFDEAVFGQVPMANAMTLATVAEDGQPRARIVLLKELDEEGFVFFTNYDSQKGRELAFSPRASLLFFWQPLDRQVRIDGLVTKVSAAESDSYFHSRPRESNISAMASAQSRPVADRTTLVAEITALDGKLGETELTRPENWGGYRLRPECIEFWQGRPDRTHDRIEYDRRGGDWAMQRLYP